MGALLDLITASLWVTVPLALAIYGIVVFVMRRRLAHLLEPATIQLFILSFGFAGFWPLYAPNDYAWWVAVLGVVLAVAPFVLFYRAKHVTNPHIFEQRDALVASLEFRVLLVISCAAIIAQTVIIIGQTGLYVGPKIMDALFMKAGGALTYIMQAATSLLPAFLLLTYRTKWFYLVLTAVFLNLVAATLLASRVSFLWPILVAGAALFLRQLDRNTAWNWPKTTIINAKNLFLGLFGISAAFGLVLLMGSLFTEDPRSFLFVFFIRFFNSFDCLFQTVYFSLLAPHAMPEYSVLIAYTQPIHKLLHIGVGQVYNNIGEYIAVHVYHYNIWKYPDFAALALPNSNMFLEFAFSYRFPLSLILITIYSTAIVTFINYVEPLRYNGVLFFCISQYFFMNATQYITDGNYFVMGLYGLAVLIVLAKILAYLLELTRRFLAENMEQEVLGSWPHPES